jgi:hypothetical protein
MCPSFFTHHQRAAWEPGHGQAYASASGPHLPARRRDPLLVVNREHAAERSDGWDVLRAPGRETNLHRLTRSEVFTARTRAGRAQYDLHGRNLQPRPGTPPPATTHIDWHNREVFRGNPLIA